MPLSLAAIIMFTIPSHHLWELRRTDEHLVPPRAVDVAVLKDSYDLCLSDQASCYSASFHITLLSDLSDTFTHNTCPLFYCVPLTDACGSKFHLSNDVIQIYNIYNMYNSNVCECVILIVLNLRII